MRKFEILTGLPSIGKSTYTQGHKSEPVTIINRDTIVQEIATRMGLTYNEMFTHPPEGDWEEGEHIQGMEKFGPVVKTSTGYAFPFIWDCNQVVFAKLRAAIKSAVKNEESGDIIIDMTMMSKADRKSMLKYISDEEVRKGFQAISIVFTVDDIELVKKMACKREKELAEQGIYKTISGEVFDMMAEKSQYPTLEEGFDLIIDVNNTKIFKKLLEHG